MRLNAARWTACALFVLCLAGALPLTRHASPFVSEAQNLGQRTVSGAVVEGDARPVPNATVFLENQKTKSIRSYTSDKDGRFSFVQVNKDQDFDLWAEKDGRKTAVKTVSSWDARKEFETELHMK